MAISAALKIYDASKTFPDEEKFGLISQIRRAAVSISSNIAEGASRSSFKEFKRFLEISIGSLFEVKSQLFLSFKLNFIEQEFFIGLDEQLSTLAKKINALISKLN